MKHNMDQASIDALVEYRNAGNKLIEVKVDYPCNNHSTNGGTKKTEEQ